VADFPIQTIDTAPEAARPVLRELEGAFGMVPNILGVMATSPVLLASLAGLFGRVHGGSFTEAEIQTLLLTNAVTNACPWAVAFHTALALKEGLAPSDVAAIRGGGAPDDRRMGALSSLARCLIETRGHLGGEEQARFLAAGFGREHLLEAIAVTAASTITNYTGNVTRPPLEAAFQAHAWSGEARVQGGSRLGDAMTPPIL
jgi:AhpD family alkylhydroperoxidase